MRGGCVGEDVRTFTCLRGKRGPFDHFDAIERDRLLCGAGHANLMSDSIGIGPYSINGRHILREDHRNCQRESASR